MTRNNLKNLIFGIYSAIALSLVRYSLSSTYSVLFLLLTGLLIYFFNKTDLKYDKRNNKFSIIISILLTIILVIGRVVWEKELYYDSTLLNINIFTLSNIIKILLISPGIFILLKRVCNLSLKKLEKVNIYNNSFEGLSTKKVYFISFIIILLCYLPYFIRFFPALMSPDSFVQIATVEEKVLTNIHPFVQTWFFGSIYSLGKLIFGSGNLALGFYIFTQMCILSALYSGIIAYLYKKNINKYILLLILLIFAISPLHAYYSVTLWKDILFGANFILVMYSLKKLNEKINCKSILLFIFSILIMLFFRNNGIYVFFVMVPCLIYYFKNNRRAVTIICSSIIVFYYLITGPLYNYIGIKETWSTEAYSIPLQQIARVIYLDKEIDNKDMKELNKLMNVDNIKTNYLPHISDPVKNSVNLEYFNKNKGKFFKIYLNLLVDYPIIYIESYLSQTLGYWYPDTVYHATSIVNAESELYNARKYDIYNTDNSPEILDLLIDGANSKSIPFSILFWSTGLYCVLLFLSIIICVYRKNNKYLYLYTPFIGLWFTMMLASPVFAELRYIYGIFVCMPLILLIPFIKERE